MAEITAELDLEISKFRAALGQANKRLSTFAGGAERKGRGLGSNLAKGFKAAFLPALAAIGVGVAAVGIGKILKDSLVEAANQEQLEVAFDVLVGDSSQATELLARIREDAANTPLQFEDLGNAAKSLLAFGAAAEEVPDTLRRIGDISSAIGAPIGEIASLYGKAQVQGRLFAKDINELTGRGIPVLQEFAKQLGVSVDQVKELGSKGKIGFENVKQAFIDLTSEGGNFHNLLERQATTLAGRYSTLKDQFSILRLEMGKPLGDALKPVLVDAIELVKSMKDEAALVGEALGDGVTFVRTSLEELSGGDIMGALGVALQIAFEKAANHLQAVVIKTFQSLGEGGKLDGLKAQFLNMAEAFGDRLFGSIKTAFESSEGFLNGLLNSVGLQKMEFSHNQDTGETTDISNMTRGQKENIRAGRPAGPAESSPLFDTKSKEDRLAAMIKPVTDAINLMEEIDLGQFTPLDHDFREAKLAAGGTPQPSGRSRLFADTPGLNELRSMQRNFGDKFGLQAGGAFSGVGGKSGGAATGSLQNAVNSLFGSQQIPERALEVAEKGVQVQEKVLATLERIEKQKPTKNPPTGRAVFNRR
ncbi:MAG: tape measure protein [Verrucomicrobiota bacterium]